MYEEEKEWIWEREEGREDGVVGKGGGVGVEWKTPWNMTQLKAGHADVSSLIVGIFHDV